MIGNTNDKNYYDVLGLDKNASQEQIKKAYRSLSKKYHPDLKSRSSEEEKKEAEDKFKEINEAYSVLSDTEKKEMYDRYGTIDPNEIGGGFNPFGGFDPFSMFSNMHRSNPRTFKGKDIYVTVEVDFDDLYTGCTRSVKVKQQVRCKHCSGTGSSTGNTDICSHCQGSGYIMQTNRMGNTIMSQTIVCPHCQGSGEVVRDKCPHCVDGLVFEDVYIDINIPAGMYGDGAQMIERGKGHYAPRRKGPQGDVIISVIELPNEKGLKRDENNNIIYTKRIDYWTMVYGGEVSVPHIGTDLKINVSAGSQSGKKVTLYRKGFPDPNKMNPNSNYIITLECDIPDAKNLTPEQKDAIDALKNAFE